jgi:hypothetical protein
MRHPRRSTAVLAILLTCWFVGEASAAVAREHASPSWREVKCTRYKAAWSGALARVGTRGLGQDFLQRHDAFLASKCTAEPDVCPRSAEEFRLANVMVTLAMNAGTASTFPPFACPR